MTTPLQPDREFIDFQQAVAGHYSLDRELGRGAMGIVFLAREVRLARPVAIKLLPRSLAAGRTDLRDRFLREAQMAAQLSHPNIVPIHHVDEVGEFVFFVMAYIEGETLGERLRGRGPLPPSEAARIFRDVGWALAYAHLRGIVHRDIKPDNILLERATGRALVSDFGIASDVQTPSTADGGYVRGTVHYLSPEQAAGAPVDGRSDLYSLGVTAYYALTGKLPFDASNAMGVLVAHASQRPRAIVDHASNVPHKLATAVERCLEKRPELRWESGEKFAEAVDAALEMPKELPTPMRVWLAQGDRQRGMGIVAGVYGTAGIVAAIGAGHAPLSAAIVAAMALVIGGPAILGLRRLMTAGFVLDDLRAGLATHVARKREDLAYASSGALSLSPRQLAIFSGVAAAAAVGAALAMPLIGPSYKAMAPPLASTAGAVALFVGVVALTRTVMMGKIGWLGSPRLWFWKSKWGERLFRLAGVGLRTPVAATTLIPQHTEVALGRALDVLFEALPRATRRELKDVPDTVRRLEDDARKLREAVDALDEAVASAQRAGQQEHADEMVRERDVATERLASVVTALETIRLGLLRLQLGAAPVASVTEAIESATRLADDMQIAAEAEREVSAAIKKLR